jgi:BlaR1 peptidase M56
MRLLEWMVQAIVLGGLFGVAALLVERQVERGHRWVWTWALMLTLAVPLLSLVPSWWPDWVSWRVVRAVPVTGAGAELSEGTMVAAGDSTVLDAVRLGWTVLSLLCVVWYAAGWVRLWRLSRGGARARLAGRDLLLTDRFGPAVVGLWRPRVVAPRWILGFPAARQRLIVMHETEHVRAGDHWLLAVAPLVAVLFPWNLPLWWQLRRLRLAVELDCDARVLSRGVGRLEYGELLLDVAGSEVVPVAAALGEPRSLLERRLEALTVAHRRPGTGPVLVRAIAAAAAVVAGCLATAPVRVIATSSSAISLPQMPRPAYGAAAGETVVRPLPRAAVAATGTVARETQSRTARPTFRRRKTREPLGEPVTFRAAVEDTAAGARGDPLFIVDGVIVASGSFGALAIERERIMRVEVLKGMAARALYGASGEHGVVMITTRR